MAKRIRYYRKEPSFDFNLYYTVALCPFCDVQRHCYWVCDDVVEKTVVSHCVDSFDEPVFDLLVLYNWWFCTDCGCSFGKVRSEWECDGVSYAF